MTATHEWSHRLEEPFPLTWSLSNFKSIEEASIRISPVTVVAGANSSGKSSLLQALLFLGQSPGDEQPPLNGPLVRLGDPSDVVRHGSTEFSIGLEVAVPGGVVSDDLPDQQRLHAEIVFGPEGADVVPNTFEVTDAERRVVLEATRRRVSHADAEAVRKQGVAFTSLMRVHTLEDAPAPPRTYLAFRSAFPVALVYRQSREQLQRAYRTIYKRSELLADGDLRRQFLMETRELRHSPEEDLLPAGLLPGGSTGTVPLLRNMRETLQNMSVASLNALVAALAERTARVEWAVVPLGLRGAGQWRSTAVARGVYSTAPTQARGQFAAAALAVAGTADAFRRLAQAVRYVGPLREEPQVLAAPTGGRHRALPVGARGEYTAEVLARRRRELVAFRDWSGELRRLPLPDAVSLWIRYLGVGDSVAVLDQGKLGRGLRIKVNGRDRDLTTIGVGASQLLPVIAAGLSVAAGSILLLEQPELHLHPAVQSRLADFFLRARPDVSFVIETHSEYLITRLRRRVAEGAVDPAQIDILFGEQDTSGTTNFRRLHLDRFGDLEEWPAGFFDAQDSDSREIIKAVKRQLEKVENT